MTDILKYPLRKSNIQPTVYTTSGVLSISEINYLNSLLNVEDIEEGLAHGDSGKRNNVGIIWLKDTMKFEWLYQKLAGVINKVNTQVFNMNLSYIETLQYTLYNDVSNSYYGQHIDQHVNFDYGTARKLSFVIQLSEPYEYEGGDLLLYTGDDFVTPRTKGDIIFFNSRTLHEVTPVTKGTRASLVGWVNGPCV